MNRKVSQEMAERFGLILSMGLIIVFALFLNFCSETNIEAERWYNKGCDFVASGQNEKALEAYNKAIEIKPDFHEAWYNKGNALFNLGRGDEALQAYEKAIKIKPDDNKTWTNKGIYFAWQQNLKNFIFPVSQGKTPYSYKLKTYQITVFSFPCIVPIALNKRIFRNFKALKGITQPSQAVYWCLNTPCPHPEYTISPCRVDGFPLGMGRLPSQTSTVPELKYPCSPAKRSTNKSTLPIENLAGTNLPNPPGHGFNILLYIKAMFFSTFFCNPKSTD